MKAVYCVFGVVLAFAMLCVGQTGQAGENVFSQGEWKAEGAKNNPAGWKVKDWHKDMVKVVTENDETFLRIEQSKAGAYCVIETALKLDPSWAKLKFTTKSRVKNLVKGDPGWKMSRIETKFVGANDKPPVIHCEESADWTEQSAEWTVPKGATALKFMVGFWESAGTFELADMTIEVTEERQLTEEEKKEAEAMRLGDRKPQDIAADSYYGKLKEEFKNIGPAYFVAGTSEEETMSRIKNAGAPYDVDGQPFKKALKVSVSERKDQPWMVNMSLFSSEPMYKGDATLLVFWARGTKGPQAVDDGAGAVIQPLIKSHVGGPKHGQLTNYHDKKDLSEKWARYWIKTNEPSQWDFPAGKLELLAMLGHKAQDIEIGGVAWMIFPKGSNLANMPKPEWNYAGRDPKAPWRAEAEKRIETLRKEDLKVKVVDASGKPVSGADVQVEMLKHDFKFGTAVSTRAFHKLRDSYTEQDKEKYREISVKYFNSASPENALKWKLEYLGSIGHIPAFKPEYITSMLDFYKSKGMSSRGHVLGWPSWHHTPDNVRKAWEGSKDKEALRQAIRSHITDAVTRYSDYLYAWDVTNETNGNRDYMDTLGAEEMVEWYKTARKANPDCTLVFNEPAAFCNEGWISGSFLSFGIEAGKGWIGYLIDKGAPIDALGTQMHGGLEDPEAVWKKWDEMYDKFQLPMEITELDVSINDAWDKDQLAYQADKLRDTLITCFAHEMITGVQLWGFWENSHWLPNAALWRKDWSIKPIGQAYIDLVYKKWWTDEKVKTGGDGTCSVRGFLGEYEVTVNANGNTAVQKVNLAKDGKEPAVIKLD